MTAPLDPDLVAQARQAGARVTQGAALRRVEDGVAFTGAGAAPLPGAGGGGRGVGRVPSRPGLPAGTRVPLRVALIPGELPARPLLARAARLLRRPG